MSTPPAAPPARGAVDDDRPQWLPFTLVCLSYLSATVGEQLLSPLFPTAARDLGLSLARGGLAFGVLTASIAIANLVGGALLQRRSSAWVLRVAALVTAAGSVTAALAQGYGVLLASQVLLGAGAGLFFPAGLQAVAVLAGPRRKGFAMGLYGVAFSAGLTVAALLGALGAAQGWRVAFWISAVLAVAAAVSAAVLRVPPVPSQPGGIPWRLVLGLPTAVGAVGAVCQYGAIPFLTTFAVQEWGLSAGGAALVLAAGRVVSIAAKLVAGAGADRVGPHASARRTGVVLVVTGLAWVLLPGGPLVYAVAALFAGTVSSLFPVANVLAVERFGQRGTALGAYRSAQIGLGAAAGVVIGVLGDAVGLRPTLTVAVLCPALLLWICRPRPGTGGAHERAR